MTARHLGNVLTQWVVAILLLSVGRSSIASIVVNGGFETGAFTGWSLSGNTGFTSVVAGAAAHSGNYSAQLGPVGSEGFITQNLPTTAGTNYVLTYWLGNDGGAPNEFTVIWNGGVVSDQLNTSSFAYTLFTLNVTATGVSTPLTFGFRQDPNFLHLDDISVDAGTAVPEPASLMVWALLAIAAGGFAIRRRRVAK